MKDIEPIRAGLTLARCALFGFILGALIPSVIVFPEFAKRLAFARSGGGGESAVWTEPLFYMVIMGLKGGLIGAGSAMGVMLLVAVIRWISKHK